MKFLYASLFVAGFAAFPAFAQTLPQLSVSVSPVAHSSIPLGAQKVPVLQLALTASCTSDIPVHYITVVDKGLGASSDISRMYIVQGNKRISRTTTLDSISHAATIRLAPSLKISPCTTETVTVVMDLSRDATPGSEHRFVVEDAYDIQATSLIVLSQKESQSSVTLTPSSVGSIEYTVVPTSSRNVLFGKDRTLLRFRLKATGTASKQQINAITFTNDGSATDADIKNLRIVTADNATVSDTITSLDGNRVRITFSSPLVLNKNDERLLQLRGDVTASRRKTIDLSVEEASDIEAKTVRRTGN